MRRSPASPLLTAFLRRMNWGSKRRWNATKHRAFVSFTCTYSESEFYTRVRWIANTASMGGRN
jgi:hypothetical protein